MDAFNSARLGCFPSMSHPARSPTGTIGREWALRVRPIAQRTRAAPGAVSKARREGEPSPSEEAGAGSDLGGEPDQDAGVRARGKAGLRFFVRVRSARRHSCGRALRRRAGHKAALGRGLRSHDRSVRRARTRREHNRRAASRPSCRAARRAPSSHVYVLARPGVRDARTETHGRARPRGRAASRRARRAYARVLRARRALPHTLGSTAGAARALAPSLPSMRFERAVAMAMLALAHGTAAACL